MENLYFWNSKAVVSIDSDEFNEEDIVEVISSQLVCKSLKNDASRRNITMPILCFDYLAEYRKDQIEMDCLIVMKIIFFEMSEK